MECARVCAQRGHDVTLYEASGELGGMLKHAKYPSFKWPLRQFMEFMIREMDKLGVNVKLNTKATREMLAAENYEVLALALGAEPSSLPLPGKALKCINGGETGIQELMVHFSRFFGMELKPSQCYRVVV